MELTLTKQGISRREILRIGVLGLGGITLPRLLRGTDGQRDISCIFLFQGGGCCQQSSWDPKPEAPLEIRGSFKDIPTAIPGVHFSELLPRSAKLANKFTVIRSMTSDIAIHNIAKRHIHSNNAAHFSEEEVTGEPDSRLFHFGMNQS